MRFDEVTYTIFLDKPTGTINSLALLCSAAVVALVVTAGSVVAAAAGGSLVATAANLLGVVGASIAAYLLLVRARALADDVMLWLACGYAGVAVGFVVGWFGPFAFCGIVWHAGLAICALCTGQHRRWWRRIVFATLLAGLAVTLILPPLPPAALRWAGGVVVLLLLLAIRRWARRTLSRTTCTQVWVLFSLTLSTWELVCRVMGASGAVAAILTGLPFALIGGGLLNGFGKLFKAINRNQRSLDERVEAEVARARSQLSSRDAVDVGAHARVQAVIVGGGPDIVFQPIDDLVSGATVGFEALSRFPGAPSRPPNEWFAEAAAVGLGPELELAAISAALHHLDEVPDHCYLSMNLSARTVCARSLADHLDGVLPGRLVLEITEHERVDDYDELRSALAELRSAGLRVAVDDAGAGFASFTHIVRLAPDVIKLDRSLVDSIDHDPVKRSLAAALIRFSAEIGATVVAEGIETRNEVHELRNLGVRYGQGFHLARPSPLAALLPRCDITTPPVRSADTRS